MHHAASVCCGERLGDSCTNVHAVFDRQRAGLQACCEILAFQPLHREKRFAGSRDAVGDVTHDARMHEMFEHSCFAFEARESERRSTS